MTTVVVAGALANKLHNGGEAWVRLSWTLGLRRLGLDVFLVEQLAGPSAEQLKWFDDVTRRFGLEGRAMLLDEHAPVGALADAADDAALLVNISGHLRAPWLLKRFRRRAYVDIDPGFTQFWAAQGIDLGLADHDLHFTIGENIGSPGCPVPTGGIEWLPARQPVVLDQWAGDGLPPDPQRLTTVASWRGPYGPIHHGGRAYGLKVHQFRAFVDLPGLAPQGFEIALTIHDDDIADRRLLEGHGWRIVDPADVAAEPEAFRHYVQGSGGEFSVAQGVYVDTGCGWFSDRTVRYLASGRPALVQDTGFSRHLPAGEGLVAFDDVAGAVAGARRLAADPLGHAQAARDVARACFDSDLVLAGFLERAGVGR